MKLEIGNFDVWYFNVDIWRLKLMKLTPVVPTLKTFCCERVIAHNVIKYYVPKT